MQRSYLRVVQVSLVVLLCIEIIASQTSLYFFIWWSDLVAHMVGGIALGGFGLWVIEERFAAEHTFWRFLSIGGFVLCSAVLWEVFEKIIGVGGNPKDTLYDILAAAFGALLVWILFFVRYRAK